MGGVLIYCNACGRRSLKPDQQRRFCSIRCANRFLVRRQPAPTEGGFLTMLREAEGDWVTASAIRARIYGGVASESALRTTLFRLRRKGHRIERRTRWATLERDGETYYRLEAS